MDENDLQKRLFKFAVDVLKLLRRLKGGIDLKIISYQLGKAATSSGANYEEAQAAVSRTDFGYKVSISLKYTWLNHKKSHSSFPNINQ